MSDDEFILQFEARSYPFTEWHHRAHIKLAYLYLTRHGFDAALAKLRAGIQAYNAANNVPDEPMRGYHETVTQFWLRIVDMTVQQYGSLPTADEFFDFHPQLSQKKNHRLFYSPGLFTSPEAKRGFVEPDITPLPMATPHVSDGAA
ncbi:MAG: hypothetical protein ACO1TE_23645 [Prosthecobacter sp.]